MKKPKVTIKTKNEEIKKLQENYKRMVENARAYALAASSQSNRRELMTIEPANENGMINGITIPELIMLVNLNSTGEETLLETSYDHKTLLIIARKRAPRVPMGLL